MSAGNARPLNPKGGTTNRPTRRGKQLNLWIHSDAAHFLECIAEETGRTQKDVIEQALYDTWDLFEARKGGADVLLFNPNADPQYLKIALGLRLPAR